MSLNQELLDRIPEMDGKLAKAYLQDVYVDYVDLNERAEQQIKDAFIAGMNFTRPSYDGKPNTTSLF